jgi:hypothetical protein
MPRWLVGSLFWGALFVSVAGTVVIIFLFSRDKTML